MSKATLCPICGAQSTVDNIPGDFDFEFEFYTCPVCGRYQLKHSVYNGNDTLLKSDLNHLGAYLAYNGFHNEYRYFTTRPKEWCDEWKEAFNKGNNVYGHPVHLSAEDVENWYPKTFSEKTDYILLYLNSHIKHTGEHLKFKDKQGYSVFFVDRYDYTNCKPETRELADIQNQANYMMKYLVKKDYIEFNESEKSLNFEPSITLTPAGYSRVDVLQKNTANGKNVLVAMKFGEDTKQLREAIRIGIQKAGYKAVFIDEVEHNNFITPELLKYIKDSPFVVVELTHQNNGAYFEEGYAMGLGKSVIQLCKSDTKLHFDIAQKNTIMWDKEDDISERLKGRIIATID